MVRLCGAGLGFLAFAATVVLGLCVGNPLEDILIRAIQALYLFFFLGLSVGWVGYRIADEYAIRRHGEMFPDGEDFVIPLPAGDDGDADVETAAT